MALDPDGNMVYRQTDPSSPIRFQADPPVCTSCKQEVTLTNFGQAYFQKDERTHVEFEVIECRGCTPIRESGPALRAFMERHNV